MYVYNIIRVRVMEVKNYINVFFKCLMLTIILCGTGASAAEGQVMNRKEYNNQKLEMRFTKEYMQKFYNDILVDQKIEKFDDYFTKDCFISINGKVFNAGSFKQRMRWIRENTQYVHVEVVNFFISQDGKQITDAHISTAVDTKGVTKKVFVIQQSKIVDNKIKDFIDATYVMEGDKDMTVVTAR